MTEPSSFDAEDLVALGRGRRAAFLNAKPFPHTVIDGLLPAEVVRQIVRDFPSSDAPIWRCDDEGPQAGKLGIRHARNMVGVSAFIHHMLLVFNSSAFVRFLEQLTGIRGLIADCHLTGGGLHQSGPGARLSIHADFNWNDELKLNRRVNALFYLNEDWDPGWGGQLELWSEDMSRCEQHIEPTFNRLVVMETSSTSHHGHPDPLRCPPDRVRRSLAFYYYTSGLAGDRRDSSPHDTVWKKRPGTDDPIGTGADRERWTTSRALARRWLPPAMAEWIRGRR